MLNTAHMRLIPALGALLLLELGSQPGFAQGAEQGANDEKTGAAAAEAQGPEAEVQGPEAEAQGRAEAGAGVSPGEGDTVSRNPTPRPDPSPSTPAKPSDSKPAGHPGLPPTMTMEDDSEPPPEPIPPAQDTLAAHLVASLSAGWVLPYGKLEKEVAYRRILDYGASFRAELGVGVSRHVLLGAWGEAMTLSAGKDCRSCSGFLLAGGPLVRYHLVQGVRFDPWVSYGVGYRSLSIDANRDYGYGGFDWLRLTLGGDWYAVRNLGLAPFSALGSGFFFDRPNEASELGRSRNRDSAAALYWSLTLGVRVTLDLPGK